MNLDQFLASMRKASSSHKPADDAVTMATPKLGSDTGEKAVPVSHISGPYNQGINQGTRYPPPLRGPRPKYQGPLSQPVLGSPVRPGQHHPPLEPNSFQAPPPYGTGHYRGPYQHNAGASPGLGPQNASNNNPQLPPMHGAWNTNINPRGSNPRFGSHTAVNSPTRFQQPGQYNRPMLGPRSHTVGMTGPRQHRPMGHLDSLRPPWEEHPQGPNRAMLDVRAPSPNSQTGHGNNVIGASLPPRPTAQWVHGSPQDSPNLPYYPNSNMSNIAMSNQSAVSIPQQGPQPYLSGQMPNQPTQPVPWRPPSGPVYPIEDQKRQHSAGSSSQQQQQKQPFLEAGSKKQMEREDDQEWVNSWLENLYKKKTPNIKQNIVTISNYRCCLKEAIKLKMELESCLTALDETCEADWEELYDRSKGIKVRLENLNKIISDEDTIQRIQELITKRKKKREWLKRRRREQLAEKLSEVERRLKLHKEIDTQRDKLAQQVLQEKQDKELKAAADTILGEVRRKLADISKASELLKSLIKLRQLRSDAAKNRGLYMAVGSDEVFNAKTEEMLKLMEGQKDTYLMEENTLKVMLETQQEETKEKEQEEARRKQAEKDRKEHKKLCGRLFGKHDELDPYSPMAPFRQYYSQAETSLEALIQVRHSWDMFLVPDSTSGSSRIPEDWVWPCDPSDDNWSSALI